MSKLPMYVLHSAEDCLRFKEVLTGYPPGIITGIRKALRCGRYQKKRQATLSVWWSPSARAAGSPRISTVNGGTYISIFGTIDTWLATFVARSSFIGHWLQTRKEEQYQPWIRSPWLTTLTNCNRPSSRSASKGIFHMQSASPTSPKRI
jgi:hypothetical protein